MPDVAVLGMSKSRARPDLNAAAQAGLEERNWFAKLPPSRQNKLLAEILSIPEIAALADSSRFDGWLNVMFVLRDAEAQGADQAKEIARQWSTTSPRRYPGDDGFARERENLQ